MFENKRPHERKAYVNKQGKICVDKVKTKGNCNATPRLAVKTPTSQGTLGIMIAISGTTAGARVKGG